MHRTLTRSLLALALAASAAATHAAPIITFGGVADGGGSQRSAVAGVTTVDFNAYPGTQALPVTIAGASYAAQSGGAGNIVTGSIPGITAAPSLTNTTAYLAVPSTTQGNASGRVSITFGGADYNYFGLFWGSIDAYNTVAFYDDGGLVWTGTGSSVATPANGCQSCAGTNRYVNFDFGSARFDRVELASEGRAFESDNHAYGSVPAPGALALLGIGLLGVAAARRRAA